MSPLAGLGNNITIWTRGSRPWLHDAAPPGLMADVYSCPLKGGGSHNALLGGALKRRLGGSLALPLPGNGADGSSSRLGGFVDFDRLRRLAVVERGEEED